MLLHTRERPDSTPAQTVHSCGSHACHLTSCDLTSCLPFDQLRPDSTPARMDTAALHYAAMEGSLGAVSALLRSGGDASIQDVHKYMPHAHAVSGSPHWRCLNRKPPARVVSGLPDWRCLNLEKLRVVQELMKRGNWEQCSAALRHSLPKGLLPPTVESAEGKQGKGGKGGKKKKK